MKRCIHKWEPVLPLGNVTEENKYDYAAVFLVSSWIKRTYFCPICGRTGHSVYGRKIRAHAWGATLEIVNHIRKELGLAKIEKPLQIKSA